MVLLAGDCLLIFNRGGVYLPATNKLDSFGSFEFHSQGRGYKQNLSQTSVR